VDAAILESATQRKICLSPNESGRHYLKATTPCAAAIIVKLNWTTLPTSTYQPVVRQVTDSTTRELVSMRWGLIGFGTKGLDRKLKTFNAREEGLTRSDLWRAPFERRRCLVPADGFYDWRKADQWPFRSTLAWPEVFAFAGLWDAWKDPSNGRWLPSSQLLRQ